MEAPAGSEVVDGEAIGNRIPLVVGVTGHRDLLPAEEPGIKQRVRDFFTALERGFPDLPLMVLTPLAEGADRIAAEVAYELGIPTIVLLPMPQRLYEHDFKGASLEEFQKMLELGERIELPILPELTEADVLHPGVGRDMQYAQLGAYLAAHSHILLAIWDGRPSNSPGGTGHVIKFHQHDIIDLIAGGQHRSPIDFTEDESDLVYHIVCSREDDGPPAEELKPLDAWWFTRNEVEPRTREMPDRYRIVFERMGEFSSELALDQDEVEFDPLLPAGELARCGQGARDIGRLFHRTDLLANRYQRLFFRQVRGTSGLALAGGVSFVAYADLPDLGFMIYPYIFFFAVLLVLGYLNRRFAWQRKYLDYRVLAEGLRVQFYWSVAGVAMENPSRFGHDSFLKRQDLELGWIRNVMRYAGYRADSRDRSSSDELVALAFTHWVKPQYEYYGRKEEDRGRHKVTGAIGTVSILVMLALAVVLAVNLGMSEVSSDTLIAIMGLLPFIYAARQHYAYLIAEKEVLAQYQHYVRIFRNAIGLLNRAPDIEMKREILRALGEAALDEQGQWILKQRERPATQPLQG